MVAGCLGERYGVGQNLLVHLHAAHYLSRGHDLPELHDGLHLLQGLTLDLRPYYPELRPPLRVTHARRDHEAVELTLRQRIGPVELVRVLGRHDEERLREAARLTLDRHLPLGHSLQKGALSSGGGAVDLVREQDRREHRTRQPLEARLSRVVDARAGDVRGQQVRGELDARETTRDRSGDGLGERRLAHAGDVRQKHMAAGEERDQAQVHNPVLAHDHPTNGASQPLVDRLDLYRTLDSTRLYGASGILATPLFIHYHAIVLSVALATGSGSLRSRIFP